MKMKLFLDEESGQAMVEYGLVIAIISTAVIGFLGFIGQRIRDLYFSSVVNGLQ